MSVLESTKNEHSRSLLRDRLCSFCVSQTLEFEFIRSVYLTRAGAGVGE